MANLNRLVDELVATGSVDTRRIYLMGWSNGGFFSQMYGIARHDRATPGGSRVAAASVYTAADPFHNVNAGQTPSCQLDPYPRSTLPIMVTSRSCDVVACDAAQAERVRAQGAVTEPGHVVATWIADLATKVGDPNVRRLIVDLRGRAVTACDATFVCTPSLGLLNHVRWPNGVADGGGIDHEPEMLGFLKEHPLAAAAPVSLIVPVVLDIAGVPPSHDTSDLVLVNRSPQATRVTIRYAPAPGTPGGDGPELAESVAAGRELRIPDVVAYLRQRGYAIPPGAAAVGSLTVRFLDVGDPSLVFAGSRASTPSPGPSGGSYGLFASAVAVEEIGSGPVTLLGLLEDGAFRTNLALVDVPVGGGPATLAIQLHDGDSGAPAGAPIPIALAPGDWKQLNSVLSLRGVRNGYATITRTGGGSDPVLAYAVVNDGPASGGGTSDGSFVAPGGTGGLVPIVLRVTSGGVLYTSELVLANTSAADVTTTLTYTPSSQLAPGAPVTASFFIPAGRQFRLPDVVSFLGTWLGLPIPSAASQGGTLLVSGDASALVRTSSSNPDASVGGTFGGTSDGSYVEMRAAERSE